MTRLTKGCLKTFAIAIALVGLIVLYGMLSRGNLNKNPEESIDLVYAPCLLIYLNPEDTVFVGGKAYSDVVMVPMKVEGKWRYFLAFKKEK